MNRKEHHKRHDERVHRLNVELENEHKEPGKWERIPPFRAANQVAALRFEKVLLKHQCQTLRNIMTLMELKNKFMKEVVKKEPTVYPGDWDDPLVQELNSSRRRSKMSNNITASPLFSELEETLGELKKLPVPIQEMIIDDLRTALKNRIEAMKRILWRAKNVEVGKEIYGTRKVGEGS